MKPRHTLVIIDTRDPKADVVIPTRLADELHLKGDLRWNESLRRFVALIPAWKLIAIAGGFNA